MRFPAPSSLATGAKSFVGRREVSTNGLALFALTSLTAPSFLLPLAASAELAEQPALKGKDYGKQEMSYEDFAKAPSGFSYKDAVLGKGQAPARGDRVVIDWTGYTIGYFGRPFETKKLKELDSKDDPYLRFELGAGGVIPALEDAIAGMSEGGAGT